jgi:hypothetical protein
MYVGGKYLLECDIKLWYRFTDVSEGHSASIFKAE